MTTTAGFFFCFGFFFIKANLSMTTWPPERMWMRFHLNSKKIFHQFTEEKKTKKKNINQTELFNGIPKWRASKLISTEFVQNKHLNASTVFFSKFKTGGGTFKNNENRIEKRNIRRIIAYLFESFVINQLCEI